MKKNAESAWDADVTIKWKGFLKVRGIQTQESSERES